jgi:hypothetical protein
MTYLPLTGLYHNLSGLGSVVFCLAQEVLIYISSRVSRQTIHLDYFSFPCSIGLDFSPICKKSDLRVNGSFHGCVDFPACSLLDFNVFFELFSLIFHAWLVPSILRCLGSNLLAGSWIVASCIFVHDLDPPNSEFGLRLKDFSWTLGFWLSLVANRFPTI